MIDNSSNVTTGEDVFVTVTRPEKAEGDRASKAIDPNDKHLWYRSPPGRSQGPDDLRRIYHDRVPGNSVPLKPRVHHGDGASAHTQGFRPVCHGHHSHRFPLDVSGCRALDGHGAAAEDHARAGVQPVLGKRRRGLCYFIGSRCPGAGSRVVLSRTTACRRHACALGPFCLPALRFNTLHC